MGHSRHAGVDLEFAHRPLGKAAELAVRLAYQREAQFQKIPLKLKDKGDLTGTRQRMGTADLAVAPPVAEPGGGVSSPQIVAAIEVEGGGWRHSGWHREVPPEEPGSAPLWNGCPPHWFLLRRMYCGNSQAEAGCGPLEIRSYRASSAGLGGGGGGGSGRGNMRHQQGGQL